MGPQGGVKAHTAPPGANWAYLATLLDRCHVIPTGFADPAQSQANAVPVLVSHPQPALHVSFLALELQGVGAAVDPQALGLPSLSDRYSS